MTTRTFPDHPAIRQARDVCDIPPNAEFIDEFLQRFVVLGPEDRKKDIHRLDRAQKYDGDLRQEAQLAKVRRTLRDVDERLKKVGL